MASLKVLKTGSSGAEVKKWQYFLIGQEFYAGKADGDFGPRTMEATIKFQRKHRLTADGIVGNQSYATAMLLGFGLIEDNSSEKFSAGWPPKPDFKPLLTDDEKRKLFGKFSFVHSPIPSCAEHIKVTDGWQAANIIGINIPQISKIAGISKTYFHKKAALQLQKLWVEWEEAGLLHLVLTWGGTYNPRFIRGSRKTLSNHAFGTAFDINIAWNRLGTVPALANKIGSVRELVTIANNNGFYWGGHFTRQDGMHFEVAKLI
ncbi:MAG TPA: M15 family metallopeptidase [Pedobacter sp.]|jgi:hypothetical protein